MISYYGMHELILRKFELISGKLISWELISRELISRDDPAITTNIGHNLVNALVVNLQLPRVPCFAHSLQLAVKACLVLPTFINAF